jgi:hypothetical protein
VTCGVVWSWPPCSFISFFAFCSTIRASGREDEQHGDFDADSEDLQVLEMHRELVSSLRDPID